MSGSKRRIVLAADRLSSAVFATAATIEGYVLDPQNPARQFAVELWLDGWAYQVRRADLYDRRAPAQSTANHGFCFSLPHACEAREAEIRLANTPIVIGAPVDLASRRDAATPRASSGSVRWLGGLTIEGHLADAAQRDQSVRGVAEGQVVFDVPARGWTYVPVGDDTKPVPRFEARLPAIFADGRFHKIEILTDDGVPLAGSPLDIVAFPDGLEHLVAPAIGRADEALRARVFDTLTPRSIPFSSIDGWLDRFPVSERASGVGGPVAVVIIGEDGVEETAASLGASETPWILAALPCDATTLKFETADLRNFLGTEAEACRTVVLAWSGTRFHPRMGAHFGHALREGHGVAFSDVILDRSVGAPLPVAYAGFDPERLLEQGAGALCFAMSRATALAAAVERTASLYDLLLHAAEDGETSPIHLPGFLATCPMRRPEPCARALAGAVAAHLERHGATAKIDIGRGTVLPAVHVVRTTAAERVTVLIPARNRAEEIRETVDALRTTRSRHGLDLHVVDMASADDQTVSYLTTLTGHHQHVFYSGESYNVARALNRAVGSVRSRYLLFLEAGCRFENTGWIDDLVGRCSQADVAAAGPLLKTQDGIIEAAGLTCDPRRGAARAFAGASSDDPGDADVLRVARSCTALPWPGMMTERRDFLAVGGFDADQFGRHLFVVDYGLKLAHNGRRVVVSPHTTLVIPRWSATVFDRGDVAPHAKGLAREIDVLRATWGDALVFEPRYSAALAHAPHPFAALAWPPRRDSLHAPPGRLMHRLARLRSSTPDTPPL